MTNKVQELDFNGDGWHMKVGQVYSSPYEPNHFLVTEILLDEGADIKDARIHYKEVNPKNYDEVYESNSESWHRAWWVNDGNWDLERDLELSEKEQEPYIREQVLWFAGQMEETLRRNDHKGGWDNCGIFWLRQRLGEEVKELSDLMDSGHNSESGLDFKKIIREAADVANFAMMIADKARKASLTKR